LNVYSENHMKPIDIQGCW